MIDMLDKQPDETELQHHKRLVYGKLVDKTLADVDYTELAEHLYGQAYASDVARRMCYGSRKTLELFDKEAIDSIDDSQMIDELDKKVVELKKERQKFYDQRREFNKLVSKEARLEYMEDSLIRAAEDLTNTVGTIYKDPFKELYNFKPEHGDDEAVVVFSDWHYGLVADNVFNHYDVETCKSRVARTSTTISQKLILHKCKKLHVVVLGDLIHGAIHCGARVASEELTSDQIMQASELLAQTIEYLSEFVDETVVYTTYGNHARTIQNKNDSIHRDNMERLVPWWLEQRFVSRDDIKIAEDTGNEFLFINACGHDICAAHGDNDSVKTSPRLLTTLFQKKYGRDIECILLGDKHHRESFNELGVTAMICGSLCGVDDYANDKRLYSEPSQLLLIVNPENGIDAEYNIKCAPRKA